MAYISLAREKIARARLLKEAREEKAKSLEKGLKKEEKGEPVLLKGGTRRVYPTHTAGPDDVIEFTTNLEQNLKEYELSFAPVQDLHGYDSPWPAGGGKNLLHPVVESVKTVYGLTLTPNADGSIRVTGTPTNGSTAVLLTRQTLTQGEFPFSAGTYTISRGSFSANDKLYLQVVPFSGTTMFSRNTAGTYTYADDISIRYIDIGINANDGSAIDVTLYPQIESGSSATSYAPYSNICPITGWTGAEVTRTGKNLLDLSAFEIDDSNYIHLHSPYLEAKPLIDFLMRHKGETFILSAEITGTPSGVPIGQIRLFHDTDNLLSITPGTAFTVPDTDFTETTVVYLYGSTNGATVENLQLELGSTASSYEPYTGDTYSISFPSSAGTVYGGTLTVQEDGTGELVVDRANIASYAGETLPGEWISSMDVYAAGASPTTGAQVVYELATPLTYTLTAPQISTLLGSNVLWADAGEMSAEYYYKDTTAPTPKEKALMWWREHLMYGVNVPRQDFFKK